jgi:hypothetical protein
MKKLLLTYKLILITIVFTFISINLYSQCTLSCSILPNQPYGNVNLAVSGGTPAYSFQWSNGAITEDLSGVSGGTYTVTVTDAMGCTCTSSVTILNRPVHMYGTITGTVNGVPINTTLSIVMNHYNGFSSATLSQIPSSIGYSLQQAISLATIASGPSACELNGAKNFSSLGIVSANRSTDLWYHTGDTLKVNYNINSTGGDTIFLTGTITGTVPVIAQGSAVNYVGWTDTWKPSTSSANKMTQVGKRDFATNPLPPPFPPPLPPPPFGGGHNSIITNNGGPINLPFDEARVCTSPTALYNNLNSTLTFSEFNYVYPLSAVNACVNTQISAISANLNCFLNTGMGNSNITLTNSNSALLVDNIGSSGNDGVRVSLGSAPNFQMTLHGLQLSTSNASTTIKAKGSFSGAPLSNLGSLTLDYLNSGTVQATTNFSPIGSTQILLQVVNNGALVGSTVLSNGVVGTFATATPFVLTGCGKNPWPNPFPPYTPCLVIFTPTTLPFTGSNSVTLIGNEFRFLANNPTGTIDYLSEVSLQAKNVNSFTVTSESNSVYITNPIPTLTEWALIIFGVVLLTVGIFYIRKT